MNLIEAVEYYAESRPDSIALVSPQCSITYRQLYDTLSYYQSHSKIEAQKRYLLICNSTIQYILKLLLIFVKKAWAVPIPKDLKESELCGIKQAAKAEDDPDVEELQIIDYNPIDRLGRLTGHETGIIHMTSGSTGKPKFCIRTLYNISMEGISYGKTLGITCQDKILNMPPLTHSFALGASLCTSITAGSVLYIFDAFQPKAMLKSIMKEKITAVILVPVMAQILYMINLRETNIFDSVRVLLSGAGNIEPEFNQNFIKKYHICIMNNYGSTETGGLLIRQGTDNLRSLGRAMEGVAVRIKKQDGWEAANGEEGELCVKTKAMGSVYLNNESMDVDDDGFLNTHDIVEADKSQNIYLKHRKKGLISVGGKKVYPNEIESVVKMHEKVEECFVVSVAKQNKNETIIAFVQADSSVTDYELRCYCKQFLSDYKVPGRFIIVRKFPKNNIGKIKYAELTALL